MKKFMQKDLSKAPNFVNRAILRTAPVLSQKSQEQFAGLPIVICRQRQAEDRGGFKTRPYNSILKNLLSL